MKVIFIFVNIVLVTNAISDQDLWLQFKKDHSKIYKTLREEKLRFEVFQQNLRTIEKHNIKYEKGEETWFRGVNQFSDINEEEFEKMYLSKMIPNFKTVGEYRSSDRPTPESIDWREKGAVLSVRNQLNCDSSWAFSTIGAVEGQNAIKNNITLELSVQELVDCSHDYRNLGCLGGSPYFATQYIRDHGIASEADYPYKAQNNKCQKTNRTSVVVLALIDIPPTESALQAYIGDLGPVSVNFNARDMKDYAGGIYNNPSCSKTLTHFALAVGYGSSGDHEYWIVKNSWGTTWGDKGYIKMTRNKDNQCGIASSAFFVYFRR